MLGRSTGGHDHGDTWGSWWATIRVCIHVVIVGEMGQGEGGREDGPRGDWRDHGVRLWVIAGRWEVAESAESCKGIVESEVVTVGHRKLGCEPNWHKGCHESFCLVDDGEFINNEEDGVHIGGGDSHILNKSRNGLYQG